MFATLKLLLPALIPSWRFFKSVEPSPRVQWRYYGPECAQGWQEFRPRPPHLSVWAMLRRLIWNPVWNETLYSVSLAERLTAGPNPHAQTEVFRLIASDLVGVEATKAVQFRLVFVIRDTADITFQSPPRPLSEIRQ